MINTTFAGGNQPVAQTSPLDFHMLSIDGQDVDLGQYKGKVVMIVNVASKCGNTPQYKALQSLFEKYGEQGFVILGFPANDFLGQEPGTNEEIKQFCSLNYGVTFPMFAKISVKGKKIDPLYRFLTEEKTNPGFAGKIDWNFAKFLVNREGVVVNRFAAKLSPEDETVIKAIEAAL
ncbi:MAG TPA: glutathione peroxidase [bacterium]|nr:glutathione peroxidase [bacterium]HPN44614.1 glutathione peroxidase [bacterium]